MMPMLLVHRPITGTNSMKKCSQRLLEKAIPKIWLQKRLAVTIEQGKLWHKGYLDSLHEQHGDVHEKSAFGIVNGLTRASQDFKGSTREQMETTASYILSPAIDSDLQAISKRWGMIGDRANQLGDKVINQYAYVAI